MTLPNFVIVGAAKAGTTALYHYLSSHPDVFMSPLKETNYFAYGRDEHGQLEYGDPELHHFKITDRTTYESLFSAVQAESAIGEASPLYLETPNAGPRIHELVPDMRIVCGIRNPVDRAYSDYLMYLRNRGRPFDPAVDLVRGAPWSMPESHWMSLGFYHAQLGRYYSLFGSERVHVYLFDDLRADSRSVFSAICRFIGVDPDHIPDLDTPHNVGGVPRSLAVERLLTSKRLRRALDPLVPRRLADRARRLRTSNLERAPAIPDAMRREMTAHFDEDLEATGRLIGRDLSRWMSSGQTDELRGSPGD